MFVVAVLVVGLACAVATRRWSPARHQLSVAATTILALLGAAVAGLPVLQTTSGWSRAAAALLSALLAALLVVHVGAWLNQHPVQRLRALRAARAAKPDAFDRLAAWADRHPLRVRGTNVLAVVVASWRQAIDVRITGLAAEMTYYALISLVPIATALGASLGYLERILGHQQVAQIEASLVDALTGIFARQVAENTLAPLIEGLLQEERTGLAIGSAVVTLWLASRMFRAAIRALDDAYAVAKRRGFLAQRILGLALALGAVITLIVLLAMVVVGPLLGDGQEIAARFGLGEFFEVAWAVVRWPAVAALSVGYLTILYRYGPNVQNTWTRSLPGAIFGTFALLAVSLGFSAYLLNAGLSTTTVNVTGSAAVDVAGQTIGLIIVGLLWVWLISIVVLLGGVLNAELDRARGHGTAAPDDDSAPVRPPQPSVDGTAAPRSSSPPEARRAAPLPPPG